MPRGNPHANLPPREPSARLQAQQQRQQQQQAGQHGQQYHQQRGAARLLLRGAATQPRHARRFTLAHGGRQYVPPAPLNHRVREQPHYPGWTPYVNARYREHLIRALQGLEQELSPEEYDAGPVRLMRMRELDDVARDLMNLYHQPVVFPGNIPSPDTLVPAGNSPSSGTIYGEGSERRSVSPAPSSSTELNEDGGYIPPPPRVRRGYRGIPLDPWPSRESSGSATEGRSSRSNDDAGARAYTHRHPRHSSRSRTPAGSGNRTRNDAQWLLREDVTTPPPLLPGMHIPEYFERSTAAVANRPLASQPTTQALAVRAPPDPELCPYYCPSWCPCDSNAGVSDMVPQNGTERHRDSREEPRPVNNGGNHASGSRDDSWRFPISQPLSFESNSAVGGIDTHLGMESRSAFPEEPSPMANRADPTSRPQDADPVVRSASLNNSMQPSSHEVNSGLGGRAPYAGTERASASAREPRLMANNGPSAPSPGDTSTQPPLVPVPDSSTNPYGDGRRSGETDIDYNLRSLVENKSLMRLSRMLAARHGHSFVVYIPSAFLMLRGRPREIAATMVEMMAEGSNRGDEADHDPFLPLATVTIEAFALTLQIRDGGSLRHSRSAASHMLWAYVKNRSRAREAAASAAELSTTLPDGSNPGGGAGTKRRREESSTPTGRSTRRRTIPEGSQPVVLESVPRNGDANQVETPPEGSEPGGSNPMPASANASIVPGLVPHNSSGSSSSGSSSLPSNSAFDAAARHGLSSWGMRYPSSASRAEASYLQRHQAIHGHSTADACEAAQMAEIAGEWTINHASMNNEPLWE